MRLEPSNDRCTARMSPVASDLLERVLSLDERDRATLAGALIESLEPPADPDVEQAWDVVIRRRLGELETRVVEEVPWSEVRERLFRGFE